MGSDIRVSFAINYQEQELNGLRNNQTLLSIRALKKSFLSSNDPFYSFNKTIQTTQIFS
jgi:hypothetical protein